MSNYTVQRPPSQRSDEELLEILRKLAERMSVDSLTMDELEEHAPEYSRGLFKSRFGSWNNALRMAGLKPRKLMNIPDDVLFHEIKRVWDDLGRQPRPSEFSRLSDYYTVVKQRFGGFNAALKEFQKWISASNSDKAISRVAFAPQSTKTLSSEIGQRGEPVYGSLLGIPEMLYAPTNLQGVLYLFGTVAKHIGYQLEAVVESPRGLVCEGKQRVGQGYVRQDLLLRLAYDPNINDVKQLCWTGPTDSNAIVLEKEINSTR
jgi:hypothetical protein